MSVSNVEMFSASLSLQSQWMHYSLLELKFDGSRKSCTFSEELEEFYKLNNIQEAKKV